ncbi:MAG: hypothetical protein KME49_03240 [Brasilonema octagenarum HA4186-MV1]|jgi:hypothetical protein|uniref:hypothetical protein n=1 Tax=Brasilonema TaxID=383614 RepID=UPI001B7CE12B|nr:MULTISPECIES: hypothetical protein [Brasilonema]MBW4624541.1 hypothetical protein [Brasilonema octagenarum HA4186-MV1]
MSKNPKIGLEGLLRPENSILVLIDHQPYQFTNLNSHEPTTIVNNGDFAPSVRDSTARGTGKFLL